MQPKLQVCCLLKDNVVNLLIMSIPTPGFRVVMTHCAISHQRYIIELLSNTITSFCSNFAMTTQLCATSNPDFPFQCCLTPLNNFSKLQDNWKTWLNCVHACLNSWCIGVDLGWYSIYIPEMLCHSQLSDHPCAARQDKNLNSTTKQLKRDRDTGSYMQLCVSSVFVLCQTEKNHFLW